MDSIGRIRMRWALMVMAPEVSTGRLYIESKVRTIYNNIIILGHITLSDNTYLPHHVYWGGVILGLDNVWKPQATTLLASMFINGSGYVVSFWPETGTVVHL